MELDSPVTLDRAQPVILGARYTLGPLLGSGGSADVYEARDNRLARPVAVKIFRGRTLPDEEIRQRTETRLLAGLSHRGLVTVFDAGSDALQAGPLDDQPRSYLVMELVRGATLGQLIRGGALPPDDVRSIGRQIAAALTYIHGRGIVHRDVKPSNILVARVEHGDEPVVAKLTDFGVARQLDDTRITEDGLTVGTANYLSPEQTMAAEIGPPSDIYSLGLVLLEGLTGQVAYPGHGVEAALARLHRAPAIPPELGTGWGTLLAAMTASEPARRPTAVEVSQRLLDVDAPQAFAVTPPAGAGLDQQPTETLTPSFGWLWTSSGTEFIAPGGGHRARPRRRRLTAVVLGGLTVACVAAAMVLTLGASGSQPRPGPTQPTGGAGVAAGVGSPAGSAAAPDSTTSAGAPAPAQSSPSSALSSAASSVSSSAPPSTSSPAVVVVARPSTAAAPTKSKGKGHPKPPGH